MMNTQSHRRLRRTVITLAAVGGLLAGGVTAAWPDIARPQLALVAAVNDVELARVDIAGQGVVTLEFGTHMIAGNDPIEIRASRRSYRDPIGAHQVIRKNGRTRTVRLPDGFVRDFSGLAEFTNVTIKDNAGKIVHSVDETFCPNSFVGGRTRPDAPDVNPYPVNCAEPNGNPFLLGAVWGMQAGWNSPTVAQSADLPAGTYTATVSVNEKYRTFFKIPAERASVTLNVTVKQADPPPAGDPASQAKAAQAKESTSVAHAHGEHAAHGSHGSHGSPSTDGSHSHQGDPNRQVAAFTPEMRPQARPPAAVARAAVPQGPRPDLRSLPAWGVGLASGNADNGLPADKTFVRFAATVWNAGNSPLVVDGFRRPGTELMDAYQYFYNAAGKQVGSLQAGTMEWDKRRGHMHWHFTDFAQYRLLKADKTLAVTSGKEAFCLANTDAVDYTIRNAKWRPSNTDLSTSCGWQSSVAVRQVLDIGSGDTYHQSLAGQAVDVTDLPNGTYYIEVLANPANKLAESNTENNSALREIILGGTPTARTITVPPHEGIDG